MARVGDLASGVRLRPLDVHRDQRGHVAEIFRQDWDVGVEPLQWTALASGAGIMRGVHVHARHDDLLVVLEGRLVVGLADLRPRAPRWATVMELQPMTALTIPHGVAHGLHSPESSIAVIGASHYFDHDDELGCRWDDRELDIPWPAMEPPDLSPRDRELPSLAQLTATLAARWSSG